MTAKECNEMEKRFMLLRKEALKFPTDSPEYLNIIRELSALDRDIKKYDASIPTYSGHTKLE